MTRSFGNQSGTTNMVKGNLTYTITSAPYLYFGGGVTVRRTSPTAPAFRLAYRRSRSKRSCAPFPEHSGEDGRTRRRLKALVASL